MPGTFQGRTAYCTLEIDPAGAGSVTLINQSGEFVSGAYTAAGDYLLTLQGFNGIGPNQATYLVSVGEGATVPGLTACCFATAATTIQIKLISGAGATADPAPAAVTRVHLCVLVSPAN